MATGEGGDASGQPDVSIVITSHNYGWCLRDAVDSALGQVDVRHEVIVVDDGSTDKSREILDGYAQVITILQDNAGQAAAMNAGLEAANAPWILFLDADDRLHPLACAESLKLVRPGVCKVQFRLDVVDREGRALGYSHPARSFRMPEGLVVPDLLLRGRYITPMTSGNLYSRGVLAQVMPIADQRFATSGDGYLNTVVPFYGEVASLQQALGWYRLHGDNIWSMTRVRPERLLEFVRHDEDRYRLLRAEAARTGLAVAQHPGERDPLHMRHRLAVAKLCGKDPVAVDFGRPSSVPVLVRTAVGALRGSHEHLTWRDAALAIWFVLVGLSWGKPLRWLLQAAYVPGSRRLAPRRSAPSAEVQ